MQGQKSLSQVCNWLVAAVALPSMLIALSGCSSSGSASEQVASQPVGHASPEQVASCGVLPSDYSTRARTMTQSKMERDGKLHGTPVSDVTVSVGTPFRARSSRGIFRADMWRYGWIIPVDARWIDKKAAPKTAMYIVFIGRDYPEGGIREGGIGPSYGNAIERLE